MNEWRSGVVITALVTPTMLHCYSVTIHRYTVSVCNQPLRPTQLPTLSGMRQEYQPRGSGNAGWLESNHRSGVSTMNDRLWYINLWTHWPTEGRWALSLHSCKEYGIGTPFTQNRFLCPISQWIVHWKQTSVLMVSLKKRMLCPHFYSSYSLKTDSTAHTFSENSFYS